MKRRNLQPEEIAVLQSQFCCSDNWADVWVPEIFDIAYVHHVRFSGCIELSSFQGEFLMPGGLKKHSGLRHVTLHNCTIGNNVLIENIANYIGNQDIGDNCFIMNVNQIVVDGMTSFGNNVVVSVLNETGGRDVPIFDNLSAHLAYIIALYRHRPNLIGRLKRIIAQYAEKASSDRGRIGDSVIIVNVGTIRNVRIGDFATLEHCTRLLNGSVNSNKNAPVYVGNSVIAEDFIISSGAVVGDAAKIVRCFIGQACQVTHNFSAHDSLLFSNCKFENGEACAIFAGPFTVSMHKSSLLIAGMYSFLNAGSGSNQSNHMYKLGPIHQGIVERGSKTTSDSYILWPARVGAFSLVMGRHHHHSDTSDMPFSYLIEKNDETYLVPGINLQSVGTIRDAQKWPTRDKRLDPKQLDCINYNLLSPYTVQKMINAIDTLKNLQSLVGETSDVYYYQNTRITGSSLRRALVLYDLAVTKFLGNSLIKRLEDTKFKSIKTVREQLSINDIKWGAGEWADLSGLFMPKELLNEVLFRIEFGFIDYLPVVEESFEFAHRNYYIMEWKWAYRKIETYYDVDLETIKGAQLIDLVKKWQSAVVRLDEMLYEDAQKEYSMTSMTGYGVSGSERDKKEDFKGVHGKFESNPFVTAIKEHIRVKTELGDELIRRLKRFVY